MIFDYLRTSYALAIPPILGFIVLTFLCLLSLVRGAHRSVNILFAAICFMGALINLDVALVSILRDKLLALKLDRMTYAVFVFSLPLYIRFIHTFLRVKGRTWLETAACLVSAAFLFFVNTDLFIRDLHQYAFGRVAQAGPVFHAFSIMSFLTVIYCLVMLFTTMKKVTDNQQKNRIMYILGGMGAGTFLLALNILPVSGFNIYPMGNFSFIPAIFLAFGVLKYDLLDIGVLIRKGTAYFILTALITIIYVLLIALFNVFFWDFGQKHALALPITLALLMTLLFDPLRTKVQVFIDRLFFRGRYDYHQLLQTISGEMASLKNTDQIKHLLAESIMTALQVTHVFVVLYDDAMERSEEIAVQDATAPPVCLNMPDRPHPLIALLESDGKPLNQSSQAVRSLTRNDRQKVLEVFDAMQAIVLVPLISKRCLTGMIGLGQKKSGQLFVQEDIELLSTVANQSVIAFDNASMYQALERLNLALERKVAERTADLYQALEEKEQTQQQLIQSESLAAIGQLVAGTAHELNNPLAGASSLVQTSMESIREWDIDTETRNEVEEDLRFSLKEMQRAGDIVRSLLDLSRQTQTYTEPVQINAVIDDALRVLYNQYKYLNVAIDKNYDANLPEIQGNFANLGQVFINVIKNALQALPESKGRISLATRHRIDADRVVAEIGDNGRGIAEEHLIDIFKPFFTTKEIGMGTGLGLYISHEIIIKHGGLILVQSELRRGTVVKIELPCQRRESWAK